MPKNLNTESDKPWNYFSSDPQYSNVLKSRLENKIEMDSALAMGRYLNQCASGDLDIVDFGGGPGHYYPVLARLYKNGGMTYRSVDIDAANIAAGLRHFAEDDKADFAVGSVLDPAPFLADRNCVVSANTLPHIPTVAPLLEAIRDSGQVRSFLFRMLIGDECVQIKKHLSGTDFDAMFACGYQHNNIYSIAYLQSVLGDDWALERLPDLFDVARLAEHSVPMQETDQFYGNRVSRPVGDMIFKGDVYMPWAFVSGTRRAG